jgi:hypothetical protein
MYKQVTAVYGKIDAHVSEFPTATGSIILLLYKENQYSKERKKLAIVLLFIISFS